MKTLGGTFYAKKGRSKYFLVVVLCFLLIYGFTEINLTKAKDVRRTSKFTIDLTLNPIYLKIETKNYVFYVNNKIIDSVKEKYNEVIMIYIMEFFQNNMNINHRNKNKLPVQEHFVLTKLERFMI